MSKQEIDTLNAELQSTVWTTATCPIQEALEVAELDADLAALWSN